MAGRRAFKWNDWNLEHATSHGCTVAEIEAVVLKNPARRIGNEKLIVEGRGAGNRVIRVIYIIDDDGPIYVIHAMPLTTRRRRGG